MEKQKVQLAWFERIFPGNNLQERISNELNDFFITGSYRKEFFVMASFAVLLLVATLHAEFNNYFTASKFDINLAFFSLATYFMLSDFLKRKQLLNANIQFIIDSTMYVGLMMRIISLTGFHDSPVAFSLMFLTAVSSPLYSSMLQVIVFQLLVVGAYSYIVYSHAINFTGMLYGFVEGVSFLVAAVVIKITLNSYKKKTDELKAIADENIILVREVEDFNRVLNEKINEKTDVASQMLAAAQRDSKQLADQKIAILNILEDVAEEKKVTILEKEKISRILQSIGDAVVAVDQAGMIIIFNHIAEKLTGWLAGEVSGKHYSEVINITSENDKQRIDLFSKVFATGKIFELEGNTIMHTKGGKELPISDSAAPIFDKDGSVNGCIMVFRDVTHEREVDRQKSEFVSVASHQLRTPLTSIKWFLEMLLDGDAGKINKEQKELLGQISESSARMIDLVNKLLNVSRIDSGRVKVTPVPTNLNAMIESLVTELTPLIKDKKLKFEVKIETFPQINIDQGLVREAIMNLLSNAIKYTPRNGRISLIGVKKDKDLLFSIEDTGIGVPKNQHNKMFGKFFRAENAVTQETEGTGMGLYVVKSIIELSGGKIWFKSEEDKGSTFFFTLPLKGSIMRAGEKSLI